MVLVPIPRVSWTRLSKDGKEIPRKYNTIPLPQRVIGIAAGSAGFLLGFKLMDKIKIERYLNIEPNAEWWQNILYATITGGAYYFTQLAGIGIFRPCQRAVRGSQVGAAIGALFGILALKNILPPKRILMFI